MCIHKIALYKLVTLLLLLLCMVRLAETVIKAVLIFAEGIFEGESHVV